MKSKNLGKFQCWHFSLTTAAKNYIKLVYKCVSVPKTQFIYQSNYCCHELNPVQF